MDEHSKSELNISPQHTACNTSTHNNSLCFTSCVALAAMREIVQMFKHEDQVNEPLHHEQMNE